MRLPPFSPVHLMFFKPFPHVKLLDQTKLKAFADDKLNITKMIISVFDRVENILEKGGIAHYEQFLLLPQSFQKASLPEASKDVIVWEWVKQNFNFCRTFTFLSASSFILISSKMMLFGKELKHYRYCNTKLNHYQMTKF